VHFINKPVPPTMVMSAFLHSLEPTQSFSLCSVLLELSVSGCPPLRAQFLSGCLLDTHVHGLFTRTLFHHTTQALPAQGSSRKSATRDSGRALTSLAFCGTLGSDSPWHGATGQLPQPLASLLEALSLTPLGGLPGPRQGPLLASAHLQ
jgi:hypothetical protein